jgi:UDP-N-acetylglucosamine 2-epimerase (non-hydrolysing)
MNSKKEKSYLIVLGARPNFVKAAPFFNRAKEYPHLSFTLVHTGQHFDDNMSKIFFEQMGIPKPDIQLDIKGEYHTEKIGKMFTALKEVVAMKPYDGVIVFGDINSALAGAIAGMTMGKQIIHIESGLRSHDRRMPEEINRAIIDHISHVLFVTEKSGSENLLKEGISKEKIHVVGNIMIESIELFRSHFDNSSVLEDLALEKGRYVVTTVHRQENTDEPQILAKILDMLNDLSKTHTLIMPLHPGTRQKIKAYGFDMKLENIHCIEPLGYIDFMKLVVDSSGVVTDSGGIQEETSHLGIPCCTLRDNTERPATIEFGSNTLFPINTMDATKIRTHLERTDFIPRSIPLWDSEVSKRIFDILSKMEAKIPMPTNM